MIDCPSKLDSPLLFFLLLLLLLFDIVTDREFRKNRSRRCVWSVVADGTRAPRHVPCRYFRLMMEDEERERERVHSLGMLRSMLEEIILFFFFWKNSHKFSLAYITLNFQHVDI